jgi:NAD(P)-dependent dehydrogenase (short-subunit alcohol dehydrogenase family)
LALRDKPVALGTGANRSIALGTVRRLIGAGYQLYLATRDVGRGREAADAVGARVIQLDVTSDDSDRHAAGIVEQGEGHLDVLVNNAGITAPRIHVLFRVRAVTHRLHERLARPRIDLDRPRARPPRSEPNPPVRARRIVATLPFRVP